MGSIPWFLFLLLHCWCIGMQLISVCWFYILQLCWIHELIIAVFWWNLLGFPYRVSCHLQRVIVWPPPGQFGCLLFLCVVWLQRRRLPILCWIIVVRVDIAVLFLTLEGKLSVFPHCDDISSGSFVHGFYDLEVWSFYPYFLKGIYQERMLYFVKCFLYIYWEDHVVFVLSFIDVMNHVNCFVDIELSLHSKVYIPLGCGE